MATPTKKKAAPEKFPTETVVSKGYLRKFRNHAGKLMSIMLTDLEFKVCTHCHHWLREGYAPNMRCQCCLAGHNVPVSR